MTRISEPLRLVDQIPCFNPEVEDDHLDYHTVGLDKLLEVEEEHFWFISRRERIVSIFQETTPKGSRVLEIGAGTAFVANGLQEAGYEIAVGELHLSGLRYAREKGIEECYQFDLFQPPFREEFDAIGMFDVLEHLDDDVLALHQVAKMLKTGGKLIVTVPAHQWLWNRDDRIAAHKRRYSKKKLLSNVKAAGLQILKADFFFISILPLLLLRSIANRDLPGVVTEEERDRGIQVHLQLNHTLLRISRLENRFSKWLPNIAGGSILCVIEK